MATTQTRIFVPWPDAPYDQDWYATLLGRVIGPLVQNQQSLEWFFFSRYRQDRGGSSGDCDLGKIPRHFERDGVWTSIRFRCGIPHTHRQAFEDQASAAISGAGCAISDWRDFDLVSDLGSNRFLGGDRMPTRREERAKLVASYLHTISELVLHAVIGPDDEARFTLEANDHDQNPMRSTFESLHHMFCNVTDVPWHFEFS